MVNHNRFICYVHLAGWFSSALASLWGESVTGPNGTNHILTLVKHIENKNYSQSTGLIKGEYSMLTKRDSAIGGAASRGGGRSSARLCT